MKNKLRIFLFILIAISVTLTSIALNKYIRIAYYEPITSEDYEYLKECATKVAQTFDTEVAQDDSVKATYSINEGEQAVYINVELIKFNTVKCKLTAKYPAKFIYKNFEVEDVVNMDLSFKINYDEVTYTETNCIPYMGEIIIKSITLGIVASLCVYYFTCVARQPKEENSEDDERH